MGAQRQDNIVLDRKILRIGKVIYMEELLHLFHALGGQKHVLILFIDQKVAVFFNVLVHQDIHLGKFPVGASPLHLPCKDIAGTVELGGFPALTGNDQWCSGLIDQYRIDLIDNGIVQVALNQIFFFDDHVVPQVIKSQFIVGDICDITVIGCPPLVVFHLIGNHTDRNA